LLNLNDLLTVLRPSLMGLSKNEPVLRALFLCKIVPNSEHILPKLGGIWHKSTFFATDFVRTRQVGRLESHPNDRGTQIRRQAKSISQERSNPCTQAVTRLNQRVAVGYQYG